MADVKLIAEKRTAHGSGPAGRLRRAGKVPGIVYGLESESVSVAVPARELGHILSGESGANTLISLAVDGDEHLTLARQIQRNPTRGDLVHVDFVRVRRDTAVSAEVPLHVEGEAPGVLDGGLLDQVLFALTVEAKPADIPNSVVVDVSSLALGDQLRIADLPVPAGVTLQHDPEDLVVQVSIPRAVVEEEAPEAEAAAAEGAEAPAEGVEPAAAETTREDSE